LQIFLFFYGDCIRPDKYVLIWSVLKYLYYEKCSCDLCTGYPDHWLNDKLVVDYHLWDAEWDSLRMNSKWKEAPHYGKFRKGHIRLQDHGNPATRQPVNPATRQPVNLAGNLVTLPPQ
jgi:hypothetical protein